jgi:glutaredoxin 3
MAEVVIYTSPFCSFCARAKTLLGTKGVAFEEIDVLADPAQRTEMVTRSMLESAS